MGGVIYFRNIPSPPGAIRYDTKITNADGERDKLACLRRVHYILKPVLLDDGLGLRDNVRDYESPEEGDNVAHPDWTYHVSIGA